jgi:hypothetical protein
MNNNNNKLSKQLQTLLSNVSLPLEESIKKRKRKEICQSDYLLISRRINIILEQLFGIISSPVKTEIEKNEKFENLVRGLLLLFSSFILLNFVTVTGWNNDKTMSKAQTKHLNKMLSDLNILGKIYLKMHDIK